MLVDHKESVYLSVKEKHTRVCSAVLQLLGGQQALSLPLIVLPHGRIQLWDPMPLAICEASLMYTCMTHECHAGLGINFLSKSVNSAANLYIISTGQRIPSFCVAPAVVPTWFGEQERDQAVDPTPSPQLV